MLLMYVCFPILQMSRTVEMSALGQKRTYKTARANPKSGFESAVVGTRNLDPIEALGALGFIERR